MSSIVIGAIIGGIIGLIVVVLMFFAKEQRFNRVLRSIKEPVEYAALYHYASFKRYKISMKFFDSYGVLYLIGKMLYYKVSEAGTPVSFNLDECTVQQEPDWRMLKWFSVTTPAGEKFYFNSQKMGFWKNNSEETLKGLAVIKTKQSS